MPETKRVEIPNVFKTLLILLLALTVITPLRFYARTSAEIAQDIINQQNALNQSQKDLENAKKNLDYYSSTLESTKTGIPALEEEIKKIEAEIEYNKVELSIYSQNRNLKELEKLQREVTRTNSVRSSYMDWRIKSSEVNKIIKEEFDIKKNEKYVEIVAKKQSVDLKLVSTEVDNLTVEIIRFESAQATLEANQRELNRKKKELEDQIAFLASQISASGNQINGLSVSIKTIQGDIQSLSEQQRVAILREEEILRQNQGSLGNTNCTRDQNAPVGSLYFCGNGRDLVMGHSTGMSQYGAKGAAEQGLSAQQIIEFYYQGASVTNYPQNSEISVRYCQGNPALAAFQEGCYAGGVYYGPAITERVNFNSYLAGLGEMPDGWPIEARKAQILAARTYALRYTDNGNPNYPICLTTYCQVSYFKSGDQSEMNVVEQTANQVITYAGQLIEALYSADNNQGNGTGDFSTRFQDLYGNPTADRPYLRSVNDNQFAQNSRMYWTYYCQSSPCGLWQWKTFGYSIGDIQSMLVHNQLGQWMQDIGGLSSLSFERDPSLRVKKVYLNGANGQIKVIGGWWFKYYWNEWVAARGSNDFLYSQTYYLNLN